MKTRIILVGGFLGAGKTTLLWEVARKFSELDKHVGLITNDQASELVDTAFLEHANGIVSEVSGSCFCCNFNGLTDAISHMKAEKQVDIIIAEPVGSCTDLSATILQPLKEQFEDDLLLAPLSVLIDPERLSDILDGGTAGLHSSAAYIMRKQLEEADIIAISKIDLLTRDSVETLKRRAAEEWPTATILAVSAKSGEGLEMWLNEVMHRVDAGTHLAEVDYDIYAEGEAVLGWLNTSVVLQSESADWDIFTKNLLNALSRRFDNLHSAVGHVKLLIEASDRFAIGNVTGKIDSLNIRGSAGIGKEAKMTLNARVQMDPDTLKTITLEEISTACGSAVTSIPIALKCLSPERPNPTYRYDHIIKSS